MRLTHAVTLCVVLIMTGAHDHDNRGIQSEARIVNGVPVNSHKYPWIVTLREQVWDLPTDSYLDYSICTGSLINISPPIVLTAAHCVERFVHHSATKQMKDTVYQAHPRYSSLRFYPYLNVNRTDNAQTDSWTAYDDYFSFDILANTKSTYDTLHITNPAQIHIHPQFNSTDFGFLRGYDIALLVFENQSLSISLTPNELALLPVQAELNEPCCTTDEEFTAVGYGRNSTFGPKTATLEETTLKYVSTAECDRMLDAIDFANFDYEGNYWSRYYFHLSQVMNSWTNETKCSGDLNTTWFRDTWHVYLQTMVYYDIIEIYEQEVPARDLQQSVCVIGEDTDICRGDSGGPLLRRMEDGKLQIVGISSYYVNGCNSGDPSVFVDVAHYMDWIRAVTNDEVFGHNALISRARPETNASGRTMSTGMESVQQAQDRWFIIGVVFVCLFGVSFVANIMLLVFVFVRHDRRDKLQCNESASKRRRNGYSAATQSEEAEEAEVE